MTEVAIPETGNLPVVSDEFVERFPALNPELDVTDMLEEALGPGGEIRLSDLTRVKVPAADFDELMVPDPDTGKNRPTEKLIGIPVAMTSRRSFWPTPDPSGKPPSCSSRDLIHGVGDYGRGSERNPTGLCEACPMSQIGSIREIIPGREGNASACKEQRLLFLLTGSELLPLMVVVPPGSLQNHKQFGMALFKRAIRGPLRGRDETTGKQVRGSSWLAVEVGLSLEKDTSGSGQRYNKLVFGMERRLTKEELAVVDAYGKFVDELIQKQADQLDRVAEEAADPNGAVRAEDDDTVYDDDGAPLDDLEDEVDIPVGGAKR